MPLEQFDLRIDGRTVHGYDSGHGDVAVVWHHGTPNIGTPPAPLDAAAARLGVRWISLDRPGYGGSDSRAGRTVTDAATDVAAVADARGIDAYAVLSHSGGGPHALAAAALDPARVRAAAVIATLAPYGAAGLDWFAGMGPAGTATLRAAAAGRAEKERFEATNQDAPDFGPADWAALEGAWGWFGTVVEPALANGPGALIDDDLAYVAPWGFDPAAIGAPVLLMTGSDDRVCPPSHARWLAAILSHAELRIPEGDGHISVLRHAELALEWLVERMRSGPN